MTTTRTVAGGSGRTNELIDPVPLFVMAMALQLQRRVRSANEAAKEFTRAGEVEVRM